MATILLQAAGAFIGGAFGTVGATIGTAAGALAGYVIDRALINSTKHSEGSRLSSARPFTAEEGASLPRVYGTVRVGGTMIWATRFEEESRTERQGAKGGPRLTTYSYYANVAFALCEGQINGIRRVWADGQEVDLAALEMRVYAGSETQSADPLILAKQGEDNSPAYRSTAYVVFDRLPLELYGNRIPQFQFEVMRAVGNLHERVKAVALIPGSTEYGLSPALVTKTLSPGEVVPENRNVLHASTDIVASLDELQALCPNLEHIALVVTWFGDDLRAGNCTIRPKVTQTNPEGFSAPWAVSGLDRSAAQIVSTHEGGAAFGGTPTDRSVIDAIAEIKARGINVTLYPFVMMDLPADNELPNPYSGASGQPAYPWRGRITCDPAQDMAETADKTIVARTQVAAFCGTADVGDFADIGDTISFGGTADDWGYRRMVLHYASLAVAAGGVDAFLLGSELRGLTALRDDENAFPFVESLCDLATGVRAILGASTAITYGADWSEYFGHQPADGSDDVYFHLDALWSHADVDAVGVDCYMPLADWRDSDHGGGNPDGYRDPYDVARMREAIAAGEGYDWCYASDADRLNRLRTPITDSAYGKPWVYRYKDLVNWWSNEHFDRPDGVEADSPTGWTPRSKPIWLTELGCPAVDKGPNQPNVFPDPKSTESAAPYFSNGARSDIAMRNLIQAHFDRWDGVSVSFEPAQNPASDVYDGTMLDASRVYLWSWDARPFPAFPQRKELWSDGDNWLLGHWLNGRINGVSIADLIQQVLDDFDAGAPTFDGVGGVVDGYVVPDPTTARNALAPLADLFGISTSATVDGFRFATETAYLGDASTIDDLAVIDGKATITRTRQPDYDFYAQSVLSFGDMFNDYQTATVRRLQPDAPHNGQESIGFPGIMDPAMAEGLLADRTRRQWQGREDVRFALPLTRIDIAPGSLVKLADENGASEYLVTECDAGLYRDISARRVRRVAPAPWRAKVALSRKPKVPQSGPPLALFLDLPLAPGSSSAENGLRLALRAKPWVAHATYVSPGDSGYVQRGGVSKQATIGQLQSAVAPGFQGRFDIATAIDVTLLSGALASAAEINVLNGANVAAMMAANGEWEIIQFADAEEVEPSIWRLTRLLRGQQGSGNAMLAGCAAGAWLVLLDGAVSPAGLYQAEVGLALNWKLGPLGSDFGGPAFAAANVSGGLRAQLPPSPVHLRMAPQPDGGQSISWVRRGRIDAEQGLAGLIPLGEASEAYSVTISTPGGEALRTATVTAPEFAYSAADIEVDFGSIPGEIEVAVAQISGTVGGGDVARQIFQLA